MSQRVIMTAADACDIDPLELPPLYDAIDPDALDTLFHQERGSSQRALGRVVFLFNDCEVVVHSDGAVDVTAPADLSHHPSSQMDTVERKNTAQSPQE